MKLNPSIIALKDFKNIKYFRPRLARNSTALKAPSINASEWITSSPNLAKCPAHLQRGTQHFRVTFDSFTTFIIPLESIYSRNFGFIEQKMYFWTLQSFKQGKLYWLTLFLPWKNICWPFQRCPLYACVSTTQRCAVPLKAF